MIDITTEVISATIGNGGATANLHTGETPALGYSIGGNPEYGEKVLPSGWEYLFGPVIYGTVEHYMAGVPGDYVGTWIREDGALVLDAPTIIADRDEAMRLADERGEEAIYCLHTGETIYI